MHFGDPFQLFSIRFPDGTRRQLTNGTEARRLAEESGGALEASRCFYVKAYTSGQPSRRVSTGQSTLLAARAWKRAKERQALGPLLATKKLLSEAVEEWLQELDAMGRRPETIRGYRSQTGVWIEFFKGRLANSLTHQDLVSFFAKRRVLTMEAKASKEPREGEEKPKPKKPAARTLNLNRALWRSFTKWARRHGYMENDLCEGVARWKEPRKEPRTLTVEEARTLLKASRAKYKLEIKREDFRPFEAEQEFEPPQYLHAIVLAGLTTLLRLGNLRNLTWSQVDLEQCTLTIPPEQSKTGAEIIVPICASLRVALSELPKTGPGSPVFGGHEIKRAYATALRRAKLKGLSFHSLRKSGATLALRSGVDFAVVQRLGAWSPGSDVLLKHYRSVGMDELRHAVDVLDGLVTDSVARVASVSLAR